uniref:Uncharacterized protein n=1 Tax=Arundo donax TaxID=35708 RepID=A0A0A9EQI0_ARUDO
MTMYLDLMAAACLRAFPIGVFLEGIGFWIRGQEVSPSPSRRAGHPCRCPRSHPGQLSGPGSPPQKAGQADEPGHSRRACGSGS